MLGRYLNQELIRDFCILYYSIKYISNIIYSEVLVNKKYFNTAQILFISTLWTKHVLSRTFCVKALHEIGLTISARHNNVILTFNRYQTSGAGFENFCPNKYLAIKLCGKNIKDVIFAYFPQKHK